VNELPAALANVRAEPTLFWLHATSDLAIALAYLAISATLGWLYYRLRHQLPFKWVVPAFGLFIVACGGTHLMHVLISLDLPVYRLAALIQGLTVGASVATAVALPPLVPKIIAMFDSARASEARKRQIDANHAEKLRALGQLASGVAHDLNQSLGIIAGYGDLASQELSASRPDLESVRESLSLVTQAAHDGGVTVKRLLTFARGRTEGEAESVDLAVLLSDVAKLTAPRWRDLAQMEGRPIDLTVESIGTVLIRGWSSTLREALLNLVLNALDALPQGGAIHLGAEQKGAIIEVRVCDTGVGIPPEVQSRIFEPFFTTKGERGTGLGLAMVFSIVERHQGTISVDARPGHGTTFTLRFPAEQSVEPHPLPIVTQPVTPRLRVLAVDDEAPLANLVAALLRPHGHHVVTATSGEEALELMQGQTFDLVISDLGMGPGMTGWELATEAHALNASVAFVLATGWGAEIDPEQARTRGVHAVLAKPFRGIQLEQVITSLHDDGLLHTAHHATVMPTRERPADEHPADERPLVTHTPV
jgi:signal transduction histidine kinase/DNA-binding NarL/FixJ family response regulator